MTERANVKIMSEDMLKARLVILGLTQLTSNADTKKAYYNLCRELHPDKHPNATPEERKNNLPRIQVTNNSYDYICDTELAHTLTNEQYQKPLDDLEQKERQAQQEAEKETRKAEFRKKKKESRKSKIT